MRNTEPLTSFLVFAYVCVCLTHASLQLFATQCTLCPLNATAFVLWTQENKTDVVLHFGMHGTVEWLPGSPLGNNGLSWSDVLMG